MTKKKDCEPIKDDRVKLGYVPGAPTSIQLIDALGGQPLDLLPVIQAGETDTSIELINETRRIRYYPEEYTRTGGDSGCFYDICIPDIEALMLVNEIGNVESTQPRNGDTLVFNSTTQMYEMVNLDDALGSLGDRITNLSNRVDALEQRVNNLSNSLTEQIARIDNLYNLMTQVNNRIDALINRISDIESAIYNWANDKTTKIPRGTINITSGGYNSDWIIQSRAKNQDNDLNFE